jgi:hypothetical protein
MKEKRNKIKDPKIYQQYQTIITRLEKEYSEPTKDNSSIPEKLIEPKFSMLTQKEKRLKIIGTLDKLYAQDKVYYAGIKQEEVEALVDTEFLDLNSSTVKDIFSNINTTCIEQDFGSKQRKVFGIESDSEVKSRLLDISGKLGQSRIVLSANYGLRLIKDVFDELSRIYK